MEIAERYQQDFPFLQWLASPKSRAVNIGSLVSAICKAKQRRLSTKQTDRKKAMKIAEQYEQISKRKLPVHTVRQTLTALAREAYGETFPSATVHEFIETWLKSKAPPAVAQSTHDFYRKSTKKLLEFLGTAAELDLSAVTRKMITEFRN